MAPPTPLPPVAFDRVMESHPIASASSILFTLPSEILQLIIGHVASNKSHLASLALVNSTCRQLARSYQFNSVVLDYGSTATKVLAMLQKEAVQRYQSSDRVTVSPSLGVCVRQLTINAASYWERLQSFMPPDGHSGRGLDNTRLAAVRTVGSILSEHLDYLYWPMALLVIPTLPNLQSLTMGSCDLDSELLELLMGLSIKSLTLGGQFRKPPSMRTGRNSCLLETLSIDASWDFQFACDHPGQLDPSAFYQTLLASCCSSLRSLELRHTDLVGMPISFDIEFPELRTLRISMPTSIDTRALSCLVREGLSSLSIPYTDASITQFLSDLGQIHTLETIMLYALKMSDSTPTRFIESNTQIRSLAIRYNQGDAFLRRIIQSLLHHENLKNLSLAWEENDIPEASLDRLSLLSQVEALHISAGQLDGWPHDWFVDHDILGGYLGRLINLRRLIIQRDTYPLRSDEEAVVDQMRYYDYRRPGSRLWAIHEARMLDHASTYVRMLPRLEFIHIGQVHFTVKEDNGVRKPVVAGSAWVGEGEYHAFEESLEFTMRNCN
ncbi:hypothetical protein F4779DRAFT_628 [Xylariaceae sp. FL0662B]|nr:hypothetical protein F4779DRAFT_628 [Xylariaceae sp. FL0662B]